MKRIFKILIVIGFILSLAGFFYIYSNVPYHRGLYIKDAMVNQIVYSFWYLEAIIGIILLIGLRKRREKYFGLFYLLIWIIAIWLDLYRYSQ
jgi:hypothetical protein